MNPDEQKDVDQTTPEAPIEAASPEVATQPEAPVESAAEPESAPATEPTETEPMSQEPSEPVATEPMAEAPEMPPAEPAQPEQAPEVAAVPVAPAEKRSFFARRKWWIVGGVVLLLVAAALTYWLTRSDEVATNTTAKTSQQKVAELGVAPTLMDGTVEYSEDAKTWAAMNEKTTLAAGDSVRTAANGRVVLTLDDGSAVRLGYNSEVKLTSLAAKDVQIETVSGEVYSRVIPSESRTYTVAVAGVDMVAKGTAFRTTNSDTQKGVEVYQSTVVVKETDVPEGKGYFTESSDAAKKDKVFDIDLNAVKSDEFLKWNVELDKQMSEAKDKLGVLADIDKPAATPAPATTQTQSNGIVLSGSMSGYTAKFTWSVKGVDTSKGFKLVRSTSTKLPVFPSSESQYVSKSSARSGSWETKEAKTYHFRICAYRGDSCDSYSNTVTLTSAGKVVEEVQHGTVSLALSGSTLSWTFTGTAPHGFKVVVSKSQNPEYPGDSKQYTTDTSYNLSSASLESGTNYVRVCKYTGSGCTDYSNQVTYIKP